MQKECLKFNSSDGTTLPAVIWHPEKVRFVLQIVHGMTEHMGRYEEFAIMMAARGIAVAGFDLRGHGQHSGDPEVASFGEGGWEKSVADIQLFHNHLRERFPNVPLFVLGFSLGSFLLRDYLNAYPTDTLAGAVIMGTGHQPSWLLSAMMGIVSGQIKKVGYDHTSNLIKQLSFGAYNQKFKPNRTEADWLCSNIDALDVYLADPLVRKNISAGLFWELLGSMKRRSSKQEYDHWDKKLPILLISGAEDPVGDRSKGVKTIYRQMQKSGMQNVVLKLIPNTRHDLLHEGPQSTELIAEWLEAQHTLME